MYAVINHVPIKPDADRDAFAAKVAAFETEFGHPDFHSSLVVRVSDTEAVFVVLYANRAALEQISREIAAPWFAQHIRPYLAGPVTRSTGQVVAGALRL